MDQDRMKNSMRNILFSYGSVFVTYGVQFVNRTMFIRYLQTDYLGLNGLFSNILSFLSLSELGIGSAMGYALYKPLKEKNTDLVCSLLALYKKLYTMIGLIIMFTGLLITPVLPYLIKDNSIDLNSISLYWILYVFQSAISYFYTYKRTLLISDQKEYITTTISTVIKLVTTLLQIVILIGTRSYTFYLIIAIITTCLENMMVSKMTEKQYPFIVRKDIQPLDKDNASDIRKNVYAMFCHKIGGVIVNGTDNILISKFIGLSVVGIYSNYTLIGGILQGLVWKVFSAMTASVGNLGVEKNKSHTKEVFDRILFMNAWLAGFSFIGYICMIQPLMKGWLGDDFLLSNVLVLVYGVRFYFSLMRNTVLMFRDALGLFWYDRYKPLVESIVNLVFSIVLVRHYGLIGVLLGTIISTLLVPFWYDAYVLFKYFFETNIKEYLFKQLLYLVTTIFNLIINVVIMSFIPLGGIVIFVCKLLVCIVVTNLVYLVIWFGFPEMKYYMNYVKRLLGISTI